MIAIVAALDAELSALERRAGVRYRPSPAWPLMGEGTLAGRQVLLARTGMGSVRAQEATAVLIQRHNPEAILSIGFAGSVVGELRVAQLVIARQVYALEEPPHEGPPAASNGLACDPALVELAVAAARQRGLAFREGASLTVPQVVSQPEVKGRIGDSLPVEMVEMESYWVGRVAADQGIPFLVARAVLDKVGDRLPDLPNMIDETGAVARGRALRQFLSRPREVPGLIRLAASALAYLRREQQSDGSWFGRWGVNYVYGTGAVLPALQAVGEDMGQDSVRRAVHWLIEHQNEDGGWGETCASYADPGLRGKGPSTASQTAWALLGLLAGGQGASEAALRGINYLLKTQAEDGSWDEPHFTATGFPRDFFINYHMYRNYFPLMALGRYQGLSTGSL